MGLLDNLFKPKPESGGEKSIESATGEEAGGSASSPKGSPFLAPKTYVPRSSVQIVSPTKTQPQGERKLAPSSKPAAAPREIVLTLGDVLSRIPTHFLREGKPDLRRELRFPADGLAADIARGRAAVYLGEIVAQCPDLFLPEVNGFDDIQIRLPLQKLVEQIAPGSANPPPVSKAAPLPLSAAPLPEKPALQPTAPTLASPAPTAPGAEEQIHLSLAAIMRRCPREIIVQPLPPIEESVRITFPFAPIERQLSNGQVEVSSLRFIAALPLGLMKHFEAKAGVKVPLPLEEIFQNLPNQTTPPGLDSRFQKPLTPPDAATEATDRAREHLKLAESILLEPMFEPVVDTVPAPAVTENVVINANFTAELPTPPALKIPASIFTPTPEPEVTPEPVPEAEKMDAAAELEQQLEALAAEDAKLDSTTAEEMLIAPLPPAPPEEVAPPVFKIEPEPPAPETPATVPEIPPESTPPSANIPRPIGLAAFRPFAPTLRPPVILQPKSGPEELRPTLAEPEPLPPTPEPPSPAENIQLSQEPIAATSDAPAPISIPIPPPASALPRPTAPVFAHSTFSAPELEPTAEPAPEPAPTLAEIPPTAAVPAPAISAPAASALHIGPPLFRPFVVHAPPIVLAPKDASTLLPEPPAPAPAPAIVDQVAAEPLPPHQPEPHPASVVEPAVEKHDAPLPPLSISETATPLLLDGQVRAFFPSDSPLPLPRVSQLLAALPGIHGCILITRSAESLSGQLPGGLDAAAIRDLSQRMRGALSDREKIFGTGEMQHLTLHAEQYSLSLFTRGETCACAIHRARIFLPSVREKFSAVADELARVSH